MNKKQQKIQTERRRCFTSKVLFHRNLINSVDSGRGFCYGPGLVHDLPDRVPRKSIKREYNEG